MSDLISRQAAIDALDEIEAEVADGFGFEYEKWRKYFCDLPPAQLGANLAEVGTDCISRQAAIDYCYALINAEDPSDPSYEWNYSQERINQTEVILHHLEFMPSAQPERRCVNCGRTVNNGGWYEDGRTRCPIEEHYAIPKDGYCHLWEKRKDWEDDYVKRAEEGEK